MSLNETRNVGDEKPSPRKRALLTFLAVLLVPIIVQFWSVFPKLGYAVAEGTVTEVKAMPGPRHMPEGIVYDSIMGTYKVTYNYEVDSKPMQGSETSNLLFLLPGWEPLLDHHKVMVLFNPSNSAESSSPGILFVFVLVALPTLLVYGLLVAGCVYSMALKILRTPAFKV
jgi:hypothetical protein